ncbi:sin3 complex subunit [Grosmannia clavigera kw1407]|uniref:Sin3 complex subunit n=1 Tax=Grosmannia clavigera (strain kw1407 / UAMH 11150) TaxID=655863 RepID=F0XU70_GROCL|nr:sin3 complex subunit [Grosmannia clavigera kw1407]EFW98705.1 sin3 complex subunit [Grosmannia clavigera kw1407]
MAFRFAIPMSQATDGKTNRDEDGLTSQLAAGRNAADITRQPSPEPRQLKNKASSSDDAHRRRHIVTPDPVALMYLEGDPSVSIVERRISLEGYELYLVEQWACSRQSPTLVISTYTGDPNHSVVVGVLSAPADEQERSPRLRIYFRAMQQYHARPKETPFGEIMATNLSSFPSALTVIAVPDGDLRKHRQDFIVNEDLKRLGCSGRSALTLLPPTRATQETFLSLYKTSDKIPFTESVVELIKLCQTALCIFGMLGIQYMDGLLCDLTEKAINDWWTEIGAECYNVEPADGILGPTTVAALLGMLMGARNRLAWYGAPVTKDVFDIEQTSKGIDYFQKAHKLKRTRRLDHLTLRKLHSVTAKAAAGEVGWGVQKAVKSTVEGFGGKRGELVIGMVGGKDKGNIGDIETVDIDKFIGLIYSERPKWLWYGKPRRTAATTSSGTDYRIESDNLFSKEEGSAPSSRQGLPQSQEVEEIAAAEADNAVQKREDRSAVYLGAVPESAVSINDSQGDKDRDRDPRRRTVFKSVAGRVSDARSGLGRIRDAVGGGLRGHASRTSRDEAPLGGSVGPGTLTAASLSGPTASGIASLAQSSAVLSSPVLISRAFTWKNKPEEYANVFRRGGEKELSATSLPEEEGAAWTDGGRLLDRSTYPDPEDPQQGLPCVASPLVMTHRPSVPTSGAVSGLRTFARNRTSQVWRGMAATTAASVAGSVADEADLQGPFLEAERTVGAEVVGLLRRHSIAGGFLSRCEERRQVEANWPRRLSFSVAEEAVLGWEEIVSGVASADSADLEEAEEAEDREADGSAVERMVSRHMASLTLKSSLYGQMRSVKGGLGLSVTERILGLEAIDDAYAQQVEEVQSIYFQLSEACEGVQRSSQELLGMERAQASEAIREVEMLTAKVEYEIGALISRVQEVEEGVRQFAEQVEGVEQRAEELQKQLETESWLHWLVRTLTGIGTGPNIIQDLRPS